MLFVITDDVVNLLSLNPVQPHVARAFNRLLSSYSDGHHILLMEPKSCKIIENHTIFSAAEVAAAKRIRNKYAEYGNLPNKIQQYAKITPQGTSPTAAKHGWDIPLIWLANNPLHISQLLGEDLYDANIFVSSGQDYLETNGLNAFVIRASLMPGGGGNTHRVLNQLAIVDQKICLCIVDSDKKSPTAVPGPTAQPCLNVSGQGLFNVVLTMGKTIENSIPWLLIDKIRKHNAVLPSLELANLEKLQISSSLYLNLKRGFCGHDFQGLSQSGCKLFWQTLAIAVAGNPICCAVGINCSAKNQGSCQYKVHSGYGNSLLSDIADWLKTNEAKGRSRKYLPSPNSTDWIKIGQIVSSFTLGQQERRI